MGMEARDRMIGAFTQDPAVTVFLMSLKAGGVALNLTAASHVMLMDPWCAALPGVVPALFTEPGPSTTGSPGQDIVVFWRLLSEVVWKAACSFNIW